MIKIILVAFRKYPFSKESQFTVPGFFRLSSFNLKAFLPEIPFLFPIRL